MICTTVFTAPACLASESQTSQAPEPDEVHWCGAQKNIHQGIDFGAKIDLQTLKSKPHLYALGPAAELRGEITIFDSNPVLTTIIKGNPCTSTTWQTKACFLVYTQVPEWQTCNSLYALDESNSGESIKMLASLIGINTKKPFAFVIKGKAKSVQYHVLDIQDNISPDGTSAPHEHAKQRFAMTDCQVTVLGFYSEHHQGIFTGEDSHVHMHLVEAKSDGDQKDQIHSGHIDKLSLYPRSIILLPATPADKSAVQQVRLDKRKLH